MHAKSIQPFSVKERKRISYGIVEDFVTRGAEEETEFRLRYWTKSILQYFLITGNKRIQNLPARMHSNLSQAEKKIFKGYIT